MNRFEATITEPGDGVARAEALLDELARVHGLDSDPVADMHVALDEVLSNILQNGFTDGQPHRIDVSLSADPATLTAEIEDDCAPFDPLALPPPDLKASLQERRVGGIGVYFVRNLMSAVRYSRIGERNRLVLEKSLVKEGEGDGSA